MLERMPSHFTCGMRTGRGWGGALGGGGRGGGVHWSVMERVS